MSYPVLSRAEARKHLVDLQVDPLADFGPVRTRPGGRTIDWDQISSSLQGRLTALTDEIGDVTIGGASRKFERQAAILVHGMMPKHVALGDPDFWTWLTVNYFVDLVKWRYPGSTNIKNFGVGGAIENLLFRAWLRGEIAHMPDNSDPYALADLGDTDFWRSHIFRQGYADGREFAQALVNFQFPIALQGKPRLRIAEIRELVKRLKTARSNLFVELMDERRATQFIETEWLKLEAATQ